MQGLFSNSLRLVFLMLKRERMVSTIWLIALTLFSVLLAYGMSKGFDDLARSALAITLDNPGIVAMMGPVYGAENYTIGAMYANTMLLWVVIGVSVMNILLVVRHTRSDEERGRLEVVRSLPTGRLAVLNASLITALLINCLLALMIGLGITALRIAGMGLANSMLYGASLGIIGLLFATIAALFSQFSANSNGAIVYSFLALGVFYLLRAAGDINNELASLVSPLGLVLRTQVFVENHWWPIPILVVECLIIMGAAFVFNAQRDIDQGFIPARPGRSKASQWLLSPYGLALRLVRGNFAVWLVVVFLLGASYGSILGDIGTFIAESPLYQQLIGTSDRFSAAMMFTTMVNLIGALVCLVPVLSISLRPLAEEKDGRAEHVLARSVSRFNYLGSFVILAYVSSVLLLLSASTGLYIAGSIVMDETVSYTELLKASLVYLPALWALIGVAVFLVGLLPKAATAIWGYVGFSFFVSLVSRFPGILPEWLVKATPFTHIPKLPVDEMNINAIAVLTVIAIIMTVIGLLLYQRRDLTV